LGVRNSALKVSNKKLIFLEIKYQIVNKIGSVISVKLMKSNKYKKADKSLRFIGF